MRWTNASTVTPAAGSMASRSCPSNGLATDRGVSLVSEGPDHRLLACWVPLRAEHPLVQADDWKERGEIPLDKEDIASACLKLGEPRVHLAPLVDEPTADAEHVLGVVPRAFDHLEIRKRDIGVNPLPLGLHGTGDLRDSPDEYPICEIDQLSKGPWHGG